MNYEYCSFFLMTSTERHLSFCLHSLELERCLYDLAKIYDHVTGKQEYLLDILNSIQVHGTIYLYIELLKSYRPDNIGSNHHE